MIPSTAEIKLITEFFIGLSVVLTALALLAIVWRDAWMMLIVFAVRLVHRVGLYDPSSNERTVTQHKRDRGFLTISTVFQGVARLIPGDPNRNPLTSIIPVVVIGIPAFLLVLIVLWAVPLFLLWYALEWSSNSWTVAASFLGVFLYIGAVVTVFKLLGGLLLRLTSDTSSSEKIATATLSSEKELFEKKV